MTTPKPRYDRDGSWKTRQYDMAAWEKVKKQLRIDLRPFYPDKNARTDPTFGHPADAWANGLLYEANSAVSTTLWLRRRLTNAELRAERDDVLKILIRAAKGLGTLSHDLDIMLGVDADVRGCRDKIMNLIPRIEATTAIIGKLPKAKKLRDAQHEAAVAMAIRILRLLKGDGISMAATTATGLGRASDAVQILKIIGNRIGLVFAEATWKRIIIKAKPRPSPRK